MQVGDNKTNYIDFIMSSLYTQLTIMQAKYSCVDNVINRNDWTQILEKYQLGDVSSVNSFLPALKHLH